MTHPDELYMRLFYIDKEKKFAYEILHNPSREVLEFVLGFNSPQESRNSAYKSLIMMRDKYKNDK
jgi:hypothetical protein